jgi:hypothetical protein
MVEQAAFASGVYAGRGAAGVAVFAVGAGLAAPGDKSTASASAQTTASAKAGRRAEASRDLIAQTPG